MGRKRSRISHSDLCQRDGADMVQVMRWFLLPLISLPLFCQSDFTIHDVASSSNVTARMSYS